MLLYEFIRYYHLNDNNKNIKASLPITTDYESYYIVFDGQQRLSSLYIAIKGSFTYEDSYTIGVIDIVYKEGENSYKESAEQITYYNTNIENIKNVVAEVQQIYSWMNISY